MPRDFSHFKENDLKNEEWAKEVRTRLADLNELLEEAAGRDIIITGTVAMPSLTFYSPSGYPHKADTITLTISQRI